MRHFQVIVGVTVQVVRHVEAETEDEARADAVQGIDNEIRQGNFEVQDKLVYDVDDETSEYEDTSSKG